MKSRRSFLKTVTLAAPLLSGVSVMAANNNLEKQQGRHPESSIKLSCASWCFHNFISGIDPVPVLQTIGQLGFDGVELMINQVDDLRQLWTNAKIAEVRNTLQQQNLALASVVPFVPFFQQLGSPDEKMANQSLDHLEQCCILAQKLGSPRIEIAAPYLYEFSSPDGKMGSPSFSYKIDKFSSGDKLQLHVAPDVNWPALERRMVQRLRKLADMARKYGLALAIEPHIHTIIPDTSGFQLIHNQVKATNMELVTDTGWATMQCEYPEMNIYRMHAHLSIVQFRDVDAQTRRFVPFGEGVVNASGIVSALKKVGFNGWISFEEVFMPTVSKDAQNFVAFMRKHLAENTKA